MLAALASQYQHPIGSTRQPKSAAYFVQGVSCGKFAAMANGKNGHLVSVRQRLDGATVHIVLFVTIAVSSSARAKFGPGINDDKSDGFPMINDPFGQGEQAPLVLSGPGSCQM